MIGPSLLKKGTTVDFRSNELQGTTNFVLKNDNSLEADRKYKAKLYYTKTTNIENVIHASL